MSFKMIFASAAALAMVAGTPAFAAGSQGEQVAASDSDSAKAKKICRTFNNTVSRMKKETLCLTRAEWKKFEAEQS